MGKRRREWERCLLILHVNQMDIPLEQNNILITLLGMMEIVNLEQIKYMDMWHSLCILEKFRLTGNKYLPQWIVDEIGEYISWDSFPLDKLKNMFLPQKNYEINQYNFTEISRCLAYFTFHLISPNSNPEEEKTEWRKFCCCISILYNAIDKKLLYPMDFLAISTLKNCILRESNMEIYPISCINILVDKMLEKFVKKEISCRKPIQVPNYPLPCIEANLREGMDKDLMILRNVVWTTAIHKGLGYRELNDEVLMNCIGFMAGLVRKGENNILRNDGGFLDIWEVLEVVGKCLSLHFLYFPNKNILNNYKNIYKKMMGKKILIIL